MPLTVDGKIVGASASAARRIRQLPAAAAFVGDSTERTRIAAEELVALKPGVIFVSTNPVITAVSQATHTIPIVFTWVYPCSPERKF